MIVETLRNRVTRRLIKLAKWSDIPQDERTPLDGKFQKLGTLRSTGFQESAFDYQQYAPTYNRTTSYIRGPYNRNRPSFGTTTSSFTGSSSSSNAAAGQQASSSSAPRFPLPGQPAVSLSTAPGSLSQPATLASATPSGLAARPTMASQLPNPGATMQQIAAEAIQKARLSMKSMSASAAVNDDDDDDDDEEDEEEIEYVGEGDGNNYGSEAGSNYEV